jgi:hypothetical protein
MMQAQQAAAAVATLRAARLVVLTAAVAMGSCRAAVSSWAL